MKDKGVKALGFNACFLNIRKALSGSEAFRV